MQCKKGLYLSFDFGWYTIHLDIAREEQWVGVTKGGRGGDQPTKSAKCNESYFSTVSKASWLILLSKK